MKASRGKDFEKEVKTQIEKLSKFSIDRIPDQMTGYAMTSTNISDFIIFRRPYLFYVECKAVRGNNLNYKQHLTENQYNGMLEKSKIDGIFCGVLIWFIDHGTTMFVPIEYIKIAKSLNIKSFNIKNWYDFDSITENQNPIFLYGEKRRVFFNYDFRRMFYDIVGKEVYKHWIN
jgi:hypothetical protein